MNWRAARQPSAAEGARYSKSGFGSARWSVARMRSTDSRAGRILRRRAGRPHRGRGQLRLYSAKTQAASDSKR